MRHMTRRSKVQVFLPKISKILTCHCFDIFTDFTVQENTKHDGYFVLDPEATCQIVQLCGTNVCRKRTSNKYFPTIC